MVEIIRQCSDDDPEFPERTPENSRLRKEHYLQHLRAAPRDVLMVSLADKLYNARSILLDLHQLGDDLWRGFNVGKEDQLWYYRGLVTAFREALRGDALCLVVDELDRVVREIERRANER